MKITTLTLATALLILLSQRGAADDMTPLDPNLIKVLGPQLVEAAERVPSPQVKVVADLENAVGVERLGLAALMLIPHKGISSDWPADVTSEAGTPLAHLFMSAGLAPVIAGEPVEQSKLRTLTVGDNLKSRHTYILLAIRKINDADWRLYGYGSEAKPMLELNFVDANGPGTKPLALEGKDIDGFKGTIVLTLLDKLQVKYPNTYSKKNRYAALDKDTKTANE